MPVRCRARTLAWGVLAISVAACSRDSGYDGRSAREWAVQLDTASDPQKRIEAANAFLRSPPQTYETIHALLTAAATDEEGIVRTMARAALQHLREDATPALVRALGDRNDSVRVRAMFALGGIGAYAYSARDTVKKLAETAGPVRAAALEALPNVDPETHSFVPTYSAALKDTSERVRLAAVRNLWAGARTLEHNIIPLLAGAVADPSDSVRLAAMQVLRQMGPPAAAALPVLDSVAKRGGIEADTARAAIAAIRGKNPPA